MNKIKLALIGLIFAIGLALAVGGRVQADDAASGQPEYTVTFSQAVTLGTTAQVITLTAARAHNIRSIVITNSASGVVRFYSTSDNSNGANLIGTFGVIANTPLPLSNDFLRAGLVGRVGEAIYVDAATGTVSLQMSVRDDLKSPKR